MHSVFLSYFGIENLKFFDPDIVFHLLPYWLENAHWQIDEYVPRHLIRSNQCIWIFWFFFSLFSSLFSFCCLFRYFAKSVNSRWMKIPFMNTILWTHEICFMKSKLKRVEEKKNSFPLFFSRFFENPNHKVLYLPLRILPNSLPSSIEFSFTTREQNRKREEEQNKVEVSFFLMPPYSTRFNLIPFSVLFFVVCFRSLYPWVHTTQ